MDWTFPYTSQRMPIFAGNAVATSQPLAAQAGLRMLLAGGNAVDAAIASAIALTVVEPTSNGIGSDAFALLWADGSVHGLNASGRSPAALSAERFVGKEAMPRLGWDAVTTPGCVSAWTALSQRFGSLPFEKLFEPAIGYARRGFAASPQTAGAWVRAVERFAGFEEFGRVFLPAGRPPAPGELVRLPDHARTLEEIAVSGGDAFYRDELARRIAEHAAASGGLLTLGDLAGHQAEWVTPLSIDAFGCRLHELPPNGQGIVALEALGMLAGHDLSALQPDCPDVLHLQIEAIKLGFADAQRHVADPRAMCIAPAALLEGGYLRSRGALIDSARAAAAAPGEPKRGGTVLVAAADASGMMITLIQSNYEGFGSGIVVPGTGIALQNRGACFTLERGHPNEVGPGKRPFHTIIPALVTRTAADGRQEPVMAFGVMGGHMQPQGHVQVLARIAAFGQNPQSALDAPRWQWERDRRVLIEPGFDQATVEELRRRGHEIVEEPARTVKFGGAQAILRMDGTYCAASDLRRDGQAVGF